MGNVYVEFADGRVKELPPYIDYGKFRWNRITATDASWKRGAGGHYKVSYALHRFIYEEAYGPIPDGFVIHHIDGDTSNNDLSNLSCMSISDHCALHMKQARSFKIRGIPFTRIINQSEYDQKYNPIYHEFLKQQAVFPQDVFNNINNMEEE